jgi:glycine cleavage system T protein (aminomethyltransferase)
MSGDAKKTALYEKHVALGARMVPFAGYLMPLSYSGQIAEHNAVRTGLGLFDLSHMGEFVISGKDALKAVDRLLTNRLHGVDVGQAVYSPMCLESGGIVDDLIAYHRPDSTVLLVVNASNIDKDEAWVRAHIPAELGFANASDVMSLVAVQGPKTLEFLELLSDRPLGGLGTYTAVRGKVADIDLLISRTGYTGEDGFELYVDNQRAGALWDRLLEAGASRGIVPIGLAARDTLRFEMGYCLYGNDIDEATSPLEAGLGWTVKLDKGDFLGREALVAQKKQGVPRRLVGLKPDDERAIPRHGYAIQSGGHPMGEVTSGTFAPSLGRGLGMGYVESSLAVPGARVEIDVRGKAAPAVVTKLPFYTKGSRPAPGHKP